MTATAINNLDSSGQKAKNRSRENSRRGQIVVSAVEVFAKRGYDGASVRVIAERAGISKGNLTYYFAVKDDLLFEVIADLHDRFLDLTRAWPPPGNSDMAALAEAFRRHVMLVCDSLNATRVSYECFRYLSSERRAIIVGKRDRYEAALQQLITACRPEDSASTVLDPLRTRTVLGMLNWPYQWYSRRGLVNPQELADFVADMALRSLAV